MTPRSVFHLFGSAMYEILLCFQARRRALRRHGRGAAQAPGAPEWDAPGQRMRRAFARRRSAQHLLRQRRLRSRRLRTPVRALFAFLFPFVETLQRLVDAHGQELDHRILHAQAAFEFLHRLPVRP